MKRLCFAFLAIGLLSASAHAEEFSLESFFAQSSNGHAAQTAGDRHHGRRHRHAYAENYAVPADAGSFSAVASYYGGGPRSLEPNSRTASGERFNMWGLTAAHRTLPIGTRLLVSHGGRSVVVRVNDRGPAAWTGRSLDVSRGAAARLGLIGPGTGHVHVTVLGRG